VNGPKNHFFHAVYNALLILGAPLAMAGVFFRYPKTFLRAGFSGFGMRLGGIPSNGSGPRPVWFHAASLGECRAALPLVKAFRKQHPEIPVVFSSTTPNGLEEASRLGLGDRVFYAPLDLPWSVRRALRRAHPRMILLLESELWPNWLKIANAQGIPVGIVNGRMSQRSYGRYGMVSSFARSVVSNLAFVCAREKDDADRFSGLGVDRERVRVTGNLKYDLLPGDLNSSAASEVPALWGKDRPVWVAGSVRAGEEDQILAALVQVRAQAPESRLVLAPRHFENLEALESRLKQMNLRSVLKSNRSAQPDWDVLIWDSFGDLWSAYRDADMVFVGGSLIGKGGQNPIEPAWFEKPVIFGPSMENFAEPARALLASGGASQVSDADGLAQRLIEWIKTPESRKAAGAQAKKTIDGFAGQSTRNTMETVEAHLKP
jgi:3-deoxy-D-manno-octulosonic-acid transferase